MSLRQEVSSWFHTRTFAVVAVAGAFVWSTSIFVGGWKASHHDDTPHTFTATGQATRHIAPDHMTWTLTVSAQASDEDAANTKLHANTARARAFLSSQGLPDTALTVKPSSASQNEEETAEDGTAKPHTWTATQELVIESPDRARVRTANQAVATDGTLGDVSEVSCTLDDSSKLEDELLAEARRDTRAKAKAAVAELGGARLGHLVSADMGNVDTAALCDGTVSAVVRAEYQLE